jgi:sec-independent protein translocase protein TatA
MNLAVFSPGPFEMIIVLVMILLLFGAKRLPDLSRSLGKSLSEFKKGREEGLKPSDEKPKVDAKAKPDQKIEAKSADSKSE